MKIAVLSGKGGAGKTMTAVNLAWVAGPCAYLDCDVEEPNGRLFLKPDNPSRREVTVPVPEIDPDRCTGCRVCVRFCRFNAMAFVRDKPFLTESVCHACGGCTYLCPSGAIRERPRAIGAIERGLRGDIDVRTGILNPGEVSGVPILREMLSAMDEGGLSILDCPPGTACAAMECVRKADLCLLVTEPTRFGAHNLAMADELCRALGKPRMAVLNKCVEGAENPSEEYCRTHGIPIVARVPFDAALGRLNSVGEVASARLSWVRALFGECLDRIQREAGV